MPILVHCIQVEGRSVGHEQRSDNPSGWLLGLMQTPCRPGSRQPIWVATGPSHSLLIHPSHADSPGEAGQGPMQAGCASRDPAAHSPMQTQSGWRRSKGPLVLDRVFLVLET